MIKSDLEKLSDCKRKLNITVPKDEVSKDYQMIIRKYRNHVTLPGFRKGKAPIKMIENIYEEQIKAGYIEEFIPKYYKQALLELEKEKVIPINQGLFEDFNWKPGEDLKVAFKFEVKPKIELKKYRDFEINFTPEKVTKKIIESELNRLQESYAKIIDKDSPVEVNDLIYYQVEKYDDEEVSKPEERFYKIGTKSLGEKFDKDLTRAKTGDVIKTIIELPPSKPEEKPTEMHVVLIVNSIKKIDLPVLDDEFAKDVGDYKTLKDLKAEIKKGFEEQVKIKNEKDKSSLILQKIIQENPFELPESIVEDYISRMINQSKKNENISQEDIQKLKEIYKKYAENEFRVYYILEKLRELEKIEINDDEIDNEITKSAELMHIEVEKYKELYQKQIDREAIKIDLMNRKILKDIESTVKFVEKK